MSPLPQAEKQASGSVPPLESALVRSRKRLLPFLLLMYGISFLDRANIAFAREALEHQVGIDASAYALGAGLFFISYALCEIPSNLILHKVGAKTWMARIMVTWGLISMATIFVSGSHSFYALRLLLGASEAGFFPGVVLYLTYWFPDRERIKVYALFYFGAPLAFIFGGPVSGLLLQMNPVGSLKNWQWMFLVEGFLAVIVGLWSYWYLEDGPAHAKWLSTAEKSALLEAVTGELGQHPGQRVSLWIALLGDSHLLQLAGIYCFLQMSVYGVVFYLPGEVSQLLHQPTSLLVGLVSAIPWACALLGAFLLSRSTGILRQRRTMLVILLSVTAVATCLFPVLPPILSLVCISMAATGVIAVQPLFWTFPAQYLSGRLAAAGLAAINAIGALGGFAAPTLKTWADYHFHSSKAGLFVLATTTLLTGAWVSLLRPYLPREQNATTASSIRRS